MKLMKSIVFVSMVACCLAQASAAFAVAEVGGGNAPEPGSLSLLLIGAGALVIQRFKKPSGRQ
jgi:hypothetical protein